MEDAEARRRRITTEGTEDTEGRRRKLGLSRDTGEEENDDEGKGDHGSLALVDGDSARKGACPLKAGVKSNRSNHGQDGRATWA
jgi:hypothetical protein